MRGILLGLWVLIILGCGARSNGEEASSSHKLNGYTSDEIRLIVASSSKFAEGLRNGGEITLESIRAELALRDKLVQTGEIALVYLTVKQLQTPWAEALYDKAASIYGGATVTLINTGAIKADKVKLYIPSELKSEFMYHMTK